MLQVEVSSMEQCWVGTGREGGGGDIKQYWEGRLTLIPYYISCHINKIETIEEFTIQYCNVLGGDEQNNVPVFSSLMRMTIFAKASSSLSCLVLSCVNNWYKGSPIFPQPRSTVS